MSQSTRRPPCRYHLAGRCRFGDSCKFQHANVQPATTIHTVRLPSFDTRAHDATPQAHAFAATLSGPNTSDNNTHADSGSSSTQQLTPNKTRLKRGEAQCYAWKAGTCRKGEKCFFAHDPQIQADELRRREAAARRARAEQERRERMDVEAARRARLAADEQELAHQARLAQEEEARRAEERRLEQVRLREEQERERFVVTAREEASRTIQRVVLGSIVTFTAGLDIRAVITGFDSCTIRVRNLPADARQDEIRDLFTQQGIDADRLLVSSVKRTQNGKQEATIVTDAEHGEVLAVGLDAIEFRDERLSFEIGVCNVAGGMGFSTARGTDANDLDVLTISWRAPSARYVGICDSMDIVRGKVRELNGRILQGRKVKVEINTPPPGRVISNFNPISIVVSNLPLDILDTDVCDFTSLPCVQRLRNNHRWNLEASVQELRLNLERYNLTEFPNNVPYPNLDGVVSIRAQFSSHDDARNAHDFLQGTRPFYLNGVLPWLQLPVPHVYTLTIPYLQYESQRRIWVDLKTSIKDPKACDITIQEQEFRGIARIRVLGSVKPAVGALKVRVENLAAGERVDGWNSALATPGNAFIRSLFTDTGAFLRGDWMKKQLKVYGDPKSVDAAREMVKRELERLAGLERTVYLPRHAVGFFVRQGLAELQAILGEESAKLNPTERTITVSGGEEARHHLDRLVAQSRANAPTSTATSGLSCPICMDDVIVPIRVGCGHSYCTACLRHYLLSALDADTFPLICMGDEGRCEVPLALPTLQRLLPPDSFNRLLEVVFTAHISKHPQDLIYCKTPDCTQVYRPTTSTTPSSLQCPSCFSTVCSGCNDEAHEGISCDDHRLHKDPEAQDRATEEWIRNQGSRIKRCPQCNVPIEKTVGCNHMSCRCGAHICWVCMGLFSPDDIYDHMGRAHGSIYTAEPAAPAPAADPFDGVDYEEQVEALRQAQMAARVARFAERMHRDNINLERQRRYDLLLERRGEREAAIEEEAARRRRMATAIANAEAARRREEAQRRQENQNGGGWCVLM